MPKNVRVIASERTSNFYVFDASVLHFQACKKIPEFESVLHLIATPEQPSYILTATGEVDFGRITLKSSDLLNWSKFNPQIRKEIMKYRNWSFCDKYLTEPVKDFLKTIKIKK